MRKGDEIEGKGGGGKRGGISLEGGRTREHGT